MTNSKERVWNALNHRGGTPVPVDFGATRHSLPDCGTAPEILWIGR